MCESESYLYRIMATVLISYFYLLDAVEIILRTAYKDGIHRGLLFLFILGPNLSYDVHDCIVVI